MNKFSPPFGERRPPSNKGFTLIRDWRDLFSIFGLACGLIGAWAVIANNLHYFGQDKNTVTSYLLAISFFLALLPRPWGLMGVLFLIPLAAGLHSQIAALYPISFLALPNAGLDLVAGFFLGTVVHATAIYLLARKQKQAMPAFNLDQILPWPIGLVLVMLTASTALALVRNFHQSATVTSLRGIIFNFIQFRPVDWHADYLPLGDWVAYAIAGSLIALLQIQLHGFSSKKKNNIVFQPIILGLIVAALLGIIQSITGFGLPFALLSFRKDAIGYAAIGFQPDLHAFAAQMLLGVVGMWGYFLYSRNKLEKIFLIATFFLCSFGLLASKSRASLFFAFLALLVLGAIYCYRHFHRYFIYCCIVGCLVMVVMLFSISAYYFSGQLISGFSWMNDLFVQIHVRDLTNLSDLSGILGSRLEIWSAVVNMISNFPLMGVGQGEFYRLSSNGSFSKSFFLERIGGENAHNYFFQVLAENGFVGLFAFAFVFIFPWWICRSRENTLPALIALLSLFLGNLFAHAFLVRENLLLATAFLALIYSLAFTASSASPAKPLKKPVIPLADFFRKPLWLGVMVGIIFLGCTFEIVSSFDKKPFLYGIDCFKLEKPISQDGWTSGAWEERIPLGTKEVELTLQPSQPNINHQPLAAQIQVLSWEAGKGKVPVAAISHEWQANEPATLHLLLPPEYIYSSNVISARLELSHCYTPRDLGVSTDARRLGVLMKPPSYR